jgi:ABC-type branched-subunit amino acid transport system ATPase component/ABC-type branched-subunit amino acid transport system permease subunit
VKIKIERFQRFLAGDLVGIYLISAAIVLVPLFTGDLYVQHLCALCGIYFILVSGYNLSAGITGLVSFGHGALYALGAYTTVLLVTRAGLPWILSAVGGVIAAMIGGVILAATGYRVKAFYLGLSTLACGWIVYKVLWNWVDLTGGQPGISVPVPSVAGFQPQESELIYVIAGFVLFSLVVCRNIAYSRTGRALKAISDNEVVAYAVGVNVPKYKAMIFTASAFFAGLAGILYASFMLFIDPSMSSLHFSISIVIILMVGGWATLFGPITGGIIYIFLPAYLGFLEEYWALVWAVVLVIILLLTPYGIGGIISALAAKLPFPRLRIGDAQRGMIYERTLSGPIYLSRKNPGMLEVKRLCKSFGGLQAVNNVDLIVEPGRIHALIGPNGSGKTTLVNLITGFYPPDSGEIIFGDKRIDGLPPHSIVDLGIVRTFQGALICDSMTTLDNVWSAHHCRTHAGIFACALATPSERREKRQYRQLAYNLLEYVGLGDEAFEPAEKLGDSQRRSLQIARALASEPKMLLLDEPIASLSREEAIAVTEKLCELRDQGLPIVLIEHHLEAVMAISDIITVLNFGNKIAEGKPEEIRANEDVVTAYLGRRWKSI